MQIIFYIFQILVNHFDKLNKVSLKIEQELEKLTNSYQLAQEQFKTISKAIDDENSKLKINKGSTLNFGTNYISEIESLVQYLDECLQENFLHMKKCVSQHFKTPHKQLTLCHQVIEIDLPKQNNSLSHYEDIRSIFEQKPRQENDIKSNLFSNEVFQNKCNLNNQVKSETNMSATTDKQKKISKKLIQSDPQQNIQKSGATPEQQSRGHQSPRTFFCTPLPKNSRIDQFNQIQQKENNYNNNNIDKLSQQKKQLNTQNDQSIIESSNIQRSVNEQQKIVNSNTTVQYSGSFSDRVNQDDGKPFLKFFKKKPLLQLNISEKSDSRKSNQREEPPIFQSPNFNGLLTKENINYAFNNHQQSQSQMTVQSRQTHNVRNTSRSYIQNSFDVNSIKTREQDPVINGSGNDESQDIDSDFQNISLTDKQYINLFQKYF